VGGLQQAQGRHGGHGQGGDGGQAGEELLHRNVPSVDFGGRPCAR
jgi:hypothetical protein